MRKIFLIYFGLIALSSCSSRQYLFSDFVGEYRGLEKSDTGKETGFYVSLTLDSTGQSHLRAWWDIYDHGTCCGEWTLTKTGSILLQCKEYPEPNTPAWLLLKDRYLYEDQQIKIISKNKLKYGKTILYRLKKR